MPNGSIDESFVRDWVSNDTLGLWGNKIWALVIQPDGKIIMAGDNSYLLLLVRLNTDDLSILPLGSMVNDVSMNTT